MHKLARRSFPNFYQSYAPRLLEFYSSWLNWTELKDNSQYIINHLSSEQDIDTSVDAYKTHLKDKYLNGFPENTALDLKTLLKNVIYLYRAKSSLKAYDFLFRVLFDSPAKLYYPREQILKTSDGRWHIPCYISIEPLPEFETYYKIDVLADRTVIPIKDIDNAYLLDKCLSWKITGDKSKSFAFIQGYTQFSGNISTRDSDGKVIGNYEEIHNVNCLSISSSSGWFYPGETLTISNPETGEIFPYKPVVQWYTETKGYYTSSKGFLSDINCIQDNYYYQNYSYVVQSYVGMRYWANIVRKLLHPAGLEFFSLMLLTDLDKDGIMKLEDEDYVRKFYLFFRRMIAYSNMILAHVFNNIKSNKLAQTHSVITDLWTREIDKIIPEEYYGVSEKELIPYYNKNTVLMFRDNGTLIDTDIIDWSRLEFTEDIDKEYKINNIPIHNRTKLYYGITINPKYSTEVIRDIKGDTFHSLMPGNMLVFSTAKSLHNIDRIGDMTIEHTYLNYGNGMIDEYIKNVMIDSDLFATKIVHSGKTNITSTINQWGTLIVDDKIYTSVEDYNYIFNEYSLLKIPEEYIENTDISYIYYLYKDTVSENNKICEVKNNKFTIDDETYTYDNNYLYKASKSYKITDNQFSIGGDEYTIDGNNIKYNGSIIQEIDNNNTFTLPFTIDDNVIKDGTKIIAEIENDSLHSYFVINGIELIPEKGYYKIDSKDISDNTFSLSYKIKDDSGNNLDNNATYQANYTIWQGNDKVAYLATASNGDLYFKLNGAAFRIPNLSISNTNTFTIQYRIEYNDIYQIKVYCYYNNRDDYLLYSSNPEDVVNDEYTNIRLSYNNSTYNKVYKLYYGYNKIRVNNETYDIKNNNFFIPNNNYCITDNGKYVRKIIADTEISNTNTVKKFTIHHYPVETLDTAVIRYNTDNSDYFVLDTTKYILQKENGIYNTIFTENEYLGNVTNNTFRINSKSYYISGNVVKPSEKDIRKYKYETTNDKTITYIISRSYQNDVDGTYDNAKRYAYKFTKMSFDADNPEDLNIYNYANNDFAYRIWIERNNNDININYTLYDKYIDMIKTDHGLNPETDLAKIKAYFTDLGKEYFKNGTLSYVGHEVDIKQESKFTLSGKYYGTYNLIKDDKDNIYKIIGTNINTTSSGIKFTLGVEPYTITYTIDHSNNTIKWYENDYTYITNLRSTVYRINGRNYTINTHSVLEDDIMKDTSGISIEDNVITLTNRFDRYNNGTYYLSGDDIFIMIPSNGTVNIAGHLYQIDKDMSVVHPKDGYESVNITNERDRYYISNENLTRYNDRDIYEELIRDNNLYHLEELQAVLDVNGVVNGYFYDNQVTIKTKNDDDTMTTIIYDIDGSNVKLNGSIVGTYNQSGLTITLNAINRTYFIIDDIIYTISSNKVYGNNRQYTISNNKVTINNVIYTLKKNGNEYVKLNVVSVPDISIVNGTFELNGETYIIDSNTIRVGKRITTLNTTFTLNDIEYRIEGNEVIGNSNRYSITNNSFTISSRKYKLVTDMGYYTAVIWVDNIGQNKQKIANIITKTISKTIKYKFVTPPNRQIGTFNIILPELVEKERILGFVNGLFTTNSVRVDGNKLTVETVKNTNITYEKERIYFKDLVYGDNNKYPYILPTSESDAILFAEATLKDEALEYSETSTQKYIKLADCTLKTVFLSIVSSHISTHSSYAEIYVLSHIEAPTPRILRYSYIPNPITNENGDIVYPFTYDNVRLMPYMANLHAMKRRVVAEINPDKENDKPINYTKIKWYYIFDSSVKHIHHTVIKDTRPVQKHSELLDMVLHRYAYNDLFDKCGTDEVKLTSTYNGCQPNKNWYDYRNNWVYNHTLPNTLTAFIKDKTYETKCIQYNTFTINGIQYTNNDTFNIDYLNGTMKIGNTTYTISGDDILSGDTKVGRIETRFFVGSNGVLFFINYDTIFVGSLFGKSIPLYGYKTDVKDFIYDRVRYIMDKDYKVVTYPKYIGLWNRLSNTQNTSTLREILGNHNILATANYSSTLVFDYTGKKINATDYENILDIKVNSSNVKYFKDGTITFTLNYPYKGKVKPSDSSNYIDLEDYYRDNKTFGYNGKRYIINYNYTKVIVDKLYNNIAWDKTTLHYDWVHEPETIERANDLWNNENKTRIKHKMYSIPLNANKVAESYNQTSNEIQSKFPYYKNRNAIIFVDGVKVLDTDITYDNENQKYILNRNKYGNNKMKRIEVYNFGDNFIKSFGNSKGYINFEIEEES